MHLPLNNSLALLCICGIVAVSTNHHHILGIFVNVHRSQLLVHLAVCRVLLQRGHQLTLVTTLPLEESDWYGTETNTSTSNRFTHILVPWQQQPNRSAEQLQQSQANFITRLQWTLEQLEHSGELLNQPIWLDFMQHVPKIPYDLMLLGYHFNEHLLGIAAHFKCPVVIVSTQQPIGFIHSLMGNPEERWYVPQPYDSRQRTGLQGLLFGLWEKSSELLARRVMQQIYSKHFPTPPYPSFELMRRRVVLSLNNHHMISEGPIAPQLPSMLDIGGIVMEQSAVGTTAVDMALSKRPFIIFSLGTRFSWRKAPRHWEECFTQAFAQLPEYDIYWTYDGSNASGINLTHTHIKLAKWWPQTTLLGHAARVRLFITHGGKGSVSEALHHGVPLLGLPLVGDQRANLHKVVRKGWGLILDMQNVSQLKVLNVIRRLLSDAQFKDNIRRDSLLYRDRPLNASYLTAYWLEYVIRHKGAKHLYSPSRELNFWQYYLLDVRLLLYGSLGIIAGILYWLNRVL